MREGERAEAVQRLAALDDRQPRALLDQARAELERERRRLEAARAAQRRRDAMGGNVSTQAPVLKRTREIGIRKAIGARERDILAQFLLEAVLIGVAGGVLGLLIGSAASVTLAALTGFPLIPSPASVIGALAVSVLVGVLAGYVPARRAARLEPVAALRSD